MPVKLKHKLPLQTILLGCLMLAIFLATLVVTRSQRTDGMVINIAGRQRMLSQRMAKEVFQGVMLASSGASTAAIEHELTSTTKLFDETLTALLHGGTVHDIDGSLRTCPVPSPRVAASLRKVATTWEQTHDIIQSVVASAFTQTDGLERISTISLELLAESNEAVTRMQEESERNVSALVIVQVIGLFVGALAVVWSILIVSGVVGRLSLINGLLRRYGKGDLTERVPVGSKNDELEETTIEVNHLGENIAAIVNEIYSANTVLIELSDRFAHQFESISTSSASTRDRADTVAASAEEASTSVSTISSAAETMSSSVSSVATAMEQMSASVNEVARNSQKESEAATRASNQVASATATMEKLGASAQEIGRVIDMISDIARKTNLLALNASIEAASAGEAGKGFSVVANEVKGLANQTGQATEEIRRQIEKMQQNTGSSVEAIQEISGIIDEVSSVSHTVASAVEEQSVTSHEIARNISGASDAAKEVARNVSETSVGLTEVSRNILTVSTESSEVASSIRNAREQALQLGKLGTDLMRVVETFQIRSSFVSWSEDLSVGIRTIDEQHKRLIAMINELNEAMAQGKGKNVIGPILTRLANYAVEHFGTEEKLFETYGYPERDSHIAVHKAFVEKVSSFQSDFETGRAMVTRDLMVFLKDWLLKHIRGTDKKYSPFLKKKGLR